MIGAATPAVGEGVAQMFLGRVAQCSAGAAFVLVLTSW